LLILPSNRRIWTTNSTDVLECGKIECLCQITISLVRFGSVRFGSVRFGSVRFGSVESQFHSVLFGLAIGNLALKISNRLFLENYQLMFTKLLANFRGN